MRLVSGAGEFGYLTVVTFMRIFFILLFICCAAHAETTTNRYDSATNSGPSVFAVRADMAKWATSTWGGAIVKELTYKKQKLVVIFRSYTSGVPTSEPYLYVEKDGHWVRVLTAMMCRDQMEATIEGDNLILWRLKWSKENQVKKIEYLRFDLKNLDAD
jgi:hypothetical protein